jgi:hypothetical protein
LDEVKEDQEATLPLVPRTFSESQLGLQEWSSKITDLLCSPSRNRFGAWKEGTSTLLVEGDLKDLEIVYLLVVLKINRERRQSVGE